MQYGTNLSTNATPSACLSWDSLPSVLFDAQWRRRVLGLEDASWCRPFHDAYCFYNNASRTNKAIKGTPCTGGSCHRKRSFLPASLGETEVGTCPGPDESVQMITRAGRTKPSDQEALYAGPKSPSGAKNSQKSNFNQHFENTIQSTLWIS